MWEILIWLVIVIDRLSLNVIFVIVGMDCFEKNGKKYKNEVMW